MQGAHEPNITAIDSVLTDVQGSQFTINVTGTSNGASSTMRQMDVELGRLQDPAPTQPPQRRPCQTDSDTYARILLTRGHGYPLWIPEPPTNIGDYEQEGVRMGDVGLVTFDGGFNYFFNIFLPPDHPLNRRAPPTLVPLNFDETSVIKRPNIHPPGCVIASESVTPHVEAPDDRNASSDQFSFICSIRDGALLILPNGADRFDYDLCSSLRQYVRRHGRGWYEYLNHTLGVDAPNGSLYLITGVDKADNWCLASYSNVSGPIPLTFTSTNVMRISETSSSENPLQITSGTVGRACRQYTCQQFGSIAARTYQVPQDRNTPNQCVFIRGFKLALRRTIFGQLSDPIQVNTIVTMSPNELLQRGQGIPGVPKPSTPSRWSWSRWFSGGNGHVDSMQHATSAVRGDENLNLSVEGFPEIARPRHPSDIIISCLLDMNPEADLALIHDDDWCAVMSKEDCSTPDGPELIRRILEIFHVVQDDACVSLEPKWSTNPDVQALVEHADNSHNPSPPPSPPRPRSSSLLDALVAALTTFSEQPFAVSLRVNSRFLRLNQSRHAAEQHATTMEEAGAQFVENHFPSRSAQVTELGEVQHLVFELLSDGLVSAVKAQIGSLFPGEDDMERSLFEKELAQLENALEGARASRENAKFSIAFFGMVKAGKSLFLNAVIGHSILPCDELPSTAWPCRLRHVKGQKEPRLVFDRTPFLIGLARLHQAKFGAKMESYSPPSESIYGAMVFNRHGSYLTPEETRLREIHAQWVDLHPLTKANLLQFEMDGFQLANEANGEVAVTALLSQLNDIVRLCHRFGLGFDMTNVEGPLVMVEFKCLRNHKMDGIYEFIDLPGIGEAFQSFDFETLIRLVAKDVNAMVPVISFKDLSRSDWRSFPNIVRNLWGRQATTVVCTHLDQIYGDNLERQLTTITNVFWPSNVMDTSSVIPCSSLIGLGARMLLDCSLNAKPAFETIWTRQSIMYHCAIRILGTGSPEATYERWTRTEWVEKLHVEMERSGLPQGINKLTREVVHEAKQRALLAEGQAVAKILRKLASTPARKLLEARRSRTEYDEAKRQYDNLRTLFEHTLRDWDGQQRKLQQQYTIHLNNGFSLLAQKAGKAISAAIQQTLDEWKLGRLETRPSATGSGLDNTSGQRMQGSASDVTVLTVTSRVNAEEFLRLSQKALHASLLQLQQEFVDATRDLAELSRARTFERLRNEIQKLDPHAVIDNLREGILDNLNQDSVNIQTVVYRKIRRQITKTKKYYRPAAAFRALEMNIASLFRSVTLSPSGEGMPNSTTESYDGNELNEDRGAIDKLGFMFRVPLVVFTCLPFIFGSPIWPWVVHSQSYSLSMDVIETKYKEDVVDPWLNALKAEALKALEGTIYTSSEVAKAAVTDALEREDGRYKLELESMGSRMPLEQIEHLVALHGSLIAAEAALWRIQDYLKAFVTKE